MRVHTYTGLNYYGIREKAVFSLVPLVFTGSHLGIVFDRSEYNSRVAPFGVILQSFVLFHFAFLPAELYIVS